MRGLNVDFRVYKVELKNNFTLHKNFYNIIKKKISYSNVDFKK